MDSPPLKPLAPPTLCADLPTVQVAGQSLTLYVETPSMLAAMCDDIQNAQHRVWLEVYTFADDAAGQQVAQLLAAKAQAGLDVRLMYDAIGSQATSSALFAALVTSGVQVHAYHSFWYALRRLSFFKILNRRNHRKLLIVDDETAYFGGMNITDTSPADSERSPAGVPLSGGWRDLHVRLAGPQAADVAESFDRAWRRAKHQPVERRPRAYRRGQLPKGSRDFIRFFDSGPGLRNSRADRVFRRLIGMARESLLFSMAYFLPPARLLRAILRARRRGCDVRVVVPGRSDVQLVQWATRYLYARLLKRGIAVFEHQGSMLHRKVMVVDGQWTIVGSCNLDPRSLEVNMEFLAVIHSAEMARMVAQICDQEVADSRAVTKADCEGGSLWRRLRDRGAYLLRWFL